MDMYAYAADPSFEKLLSDNRDRYIEQSSKTRCGHVAGLPSRDRSMSMERTSRAEMSVWCSETED